MKRLTKIALAAAVAAFAVSPALAQQQRGRGFGGFGGGVLFLLGQKSVKEELKLSDEQVKKITEYAEKQNADRIDFQSLSREEIQKKMAERTKAQNDAVAKILNDKQLKRVKQISLQQQARFSLAFVVTNEEIAKSLNISDDQKGKIRELQTKAREETQGLGFDEDGRKKRQEVMQATNEKITAVLTAEQKTKLKEMQGEPFKGEIVFRRPGGGQGRQR